MAGGAVARPTATPKMACRSYRGGKVEVIGQVCLRVDASI
jgi:hypothetical protein